MKCEVKGDELVAEMDETLCAVNVKALYDEFKSWFSGAQNFTGLVVNLGRVTVIDSLGVNLLVGLYKECRKNNKVFRVIEPSPAIRRLFELYKLTAYFGIE